MIRYFTLNPTFINRLMLPEERISPIELSEGKCGAIWLST